MLCVVQDEVGNQPHFILSCEMPVCEMHVFLSDVFYNDVHIYMQFLESTRAFEGLKMNAY